MKVFEDFCVMTVASERSRLVPLKAMLTGNPTPLANTAIDIPSVITVVVIKPVSAIPVTVLNRFIFFGNPFTKFNFIKKKSLNFCKFF